ncbi:beta-1,3-galactosyltransferase 5-like [Lycorma delicatula]|uniref:beta-1,3-galactosyltransferase 5-like n=1 Tax=Lycorma delicatula TaxID=130591 RepID=UPI003F5145DA
MGSKAPLLDVGLLSIKNTSSRTIPVKNKTEDLEYTRSGILTKCLYESGYDIANVDMCPDLGKKLKLLVAIVSAINNYKERMAVRQTWGHYGQRNDVVICFFLGSSNEIDIENRVKAEAELYGDIVKSQLMDSYNNLTLKIISLTEWVHKYCTNVRFVLKTDDDMFINVPRLLSLINYIFDYKRTIVGRLAIKWRPVRNSNSKYFVSVRQFSSYFFPNFVTGPAYLLSGDTVYDLYKNALERYYLKLEDVFTTGIVAEALAIKRFHCQLFLNKWIPYSEYNIKNVISIHTQSFHEQFYLWKKLLDN